MNHLCFFFLLSSMKTIHSSHFNGGTIRWYPVNPYTNSPSVTITIVQTYFWNYPLMTCANDVPISTPSRAGTASKIACVVDCSTDGGYSSNQVTILTDCVSASKTAGTMVSERAVNATLSANAHFYASYSGNAWTALNSPRRVGLEWSILFFIDLRKRPDGVINTPPEVQVVSPQYAIVNQNLQIPIQVSDANPGDTIRCRWSIQTPGYRRRRHVNEENNIMNLPEHDNGNLVRKKRLTATSFACILRCAQGCPCNSSRCLGTNCTGSTCASTLCTSLNVTAKTTRTTTTTDPLSVTNTTTETTATVRATSSYATRQTIDECGDICFPTNIPNDTTISDCTINFRGLIADTWYAVAIQVEDFISPTSTTPMSSVPVQLLIYVQPQPICLSAPTIMPYEECIEVAVNTTKTFELFIFNPCEPDDIAINEMFVSKKVTGLNMSSLTVMATDPSMAFVNISWTPHSDQIGRQKFCTIAYTDERVGSAEYCITFLVKSSLPVCDNTTTIPPLTSANLHSTQASTNGPYKIPDWDLALRLLAIILPITTCLSCCLYHLLKYICQRRRKEEEEKEEEEQNGGGGAKKGGVTTTTSIETTVEISPSEEESSQIAVPKTSYEVYFIQAHEYRALSAFSLSSMRTSSSLSTTRTNTTLVTEKESSEPEESKDIKESGTTSNFLEVTPQVTAPNRLSVNTGMDMILDSSGSSDEEEAVTPPPPIIVVSYGESDWSDVQLPDPPKTTHVSPAPSVSPHQKQFAAKKEDAAHWARNYLYGFRKTKNSS